MKKLKLLIPILILALVMGLSLSSCTFFSLSDDDNSDGGRITDSDTNNNNGIITNLSNIILDTTPTPAASGKSRADIIEEIQDSVVTINTTLSNGTSAGAGVLVAVSEEEGYSYIITCLHVVDGYTAINVTMTDNTTHSAEFVGGLPDKDIAVLRIAVKDNITIAKLRDYENYPIRTGEDAIAIGNPLGTLGGTVTKGIISAPSREINIEGSMMTLLQTDAAINGGNSGGGLFDENGLLIGIVNAKTVKDSSGNAVEGIGFAIPIDDAVEVAQQLLNTRGNSLYNGLGYVPGKIMLGITTQSGSYNLGENSYYASYITALSLYGSAYNSGLQAGDYIIKVDNQALSETRTIGDILKTKTVGDTMTFTVIRRIAYNSGFFTQYRYVEQSPITITLRQYVYGYNHS
jgi:serine protease Do